MLISTLFNERIGRQVLAELLLSMVYTPVICLLCYYIIFAPTQSRPIDPRAPILFTIILFLIQLVYLFYQCFSDYLIQFRRSVMREEKLTYENMMVQYKALQHHLSPHFLFNCLSGLNSTITESPSKAAGIVSSMSDCLRHVLTAPEHPTIPLDAELKFLSDYHKLLEMRFPGSIILVDHIDLADRQKTVPPCLLQLLVENAVKHNDISPEHPVTISLSSLPPNKLEVCSIATRRIGLNGSSRTGIGLKNIKDRYALLTKEEVSITHSSEEFTVILPLLENQLYENTDHRK